MRERAVRLVRESEASNASRWAALVSVSGKISRTAETLRRWVQEAEIDAGVRPGVSTDMAARVSDCLFGQAVFHVVRSRMMALRMVMSLRMQAVTDAPRKTRARPPLPTHAAAARLSPQAALTRISPLNRMTYVKPNRAR